MFKGVKKEGIMTNNTFDVIFGKTAKFTGTISCEGSIRMDGKGVGDLKSEGDVLIGPEAALEGNIEAGNIEISGEVHGNVKATGAFRIFETGVLFGDINVSSFAIDEGGVFEGMCHINTKGTKQVLPSKQTVPDKHYNATEKNDQKNNQSSNNKENKTPA